MTTRLALLAALSFTALPIAADTMPGRAPHSANPILPGYFANPSIVQDGGMIYIYATLDPWGGETLGCWESDDFKNWTYRVLDWPTKKAFTSPTSESAAVWAPSVIEGTNGRSWEKVEDHTEAAITGSPMISERPVTARYLRLDFPEDVEGSDIGIFEWPVF